MKRAAKLLMVLLFATGLTSAQTPGCTDPLANNYNSAANLNDGSCMYNAQSISPLTSYYLDSLLEECSGLIQWNNTLWTHNDNVDSNLYTIDTLDGTILQSYPLNDIINTDWEEISQDSQYIYVGDFGNNVNGNRTNLYILRIEKNSFLSGNPVIDSIQFIYADQTDFTATGLNNTNFDCEAFVVGADSIYLFTKEWVSRQTSIYALAKTPGVHVAMRKSNYNVDGLITGAVAIESKQMVALCGYSTSLEPFVYLLFDFQNNEFFSGNKRKINLSLPFHQVEAITTTNGLKYYLSNEAFIQSPFNITQKLHTVDLSPYLSNYLDNLVLSTRKHVFDQHTNVYPNPSKDYFIIETNELPMHYNLLNSIGQHVKSGELTKRSTRIRMEDFVNGKYILILENENKSYFKIFKN